MTVRSRWRHGGREYMAWSENLRDPMLVCDVTPIDRSGYPGAFDRLIEPTDETETL